MLRSLLSLFKSTPKKTTDSSEYKGYVDLNEQDEEALVIETPPDTPHSSTPPVTLDHILLQNKRKFQTLNKIDPISIKKMRLAIDEIETKQEKKWLPLTDHHLITLFGSTPPPKPSHSKTEEKTFNAIDADSQFEPPHQINQPASHKRRRRQ